MNFQLIEKLESFHDLEPEIEDFRSAVLRGLSAKNKYLPCKFFYDLRGSQLFDQICELEEYYVTRTEVGLLNENLVEIIECLGPQCHLVEFGSGSSTKVRILLDKMEKAAGYTGIDISRDHLISSCAELSDVYPNLAIRAVCGDYSEALAVPALENSSGRPVAFFPGSSLGNFDEADAVKFLAGVANFLSKSGGGLLIGIDLKKDEGTLNAAYDDSKGITAAFNLNLLVRANKEIGADFDLSAFDHRAFYNSDLGRIEMHLVSTKSQSVEIDDFTFSFFQGESIHTENSYKYSLNEFSSMCAMAGFKLTKVWCDSMDLFSVHYMETSSLRA